MRFPRLRGIPGSSSWSSREIFGLAVPSVLIARHRKIGSLPQFVALPRQCLAPRCKTLHEWPQQSPSARPPSAICPVHRCHCAPSPRDQGNCGMSLAPCTDESRKSVVRTMGFPELDKGYSYGELLEVMDKANIATNVIGLVGHGALRSVVMGLQAPQVATDEEVEEMVSLLEKSLEEGAFGMSTGLEYHPGKMAGFDELAALCRAVAQVDGFYATHSRNRDKRYFVGFGEAMDLARETGVRLQISHINPKYGRPDHAMRNTLQMIEWAREEGIDVAMDMMPTNWNFTSAMAQLPAWSYSLSKDEFLELLKSDEGREQLKINPLPMWQLVVEEKWDKIKLMSSFANKQYISWTIEEIAQKKGTTGWDVIFDLLLEEGDRHQAVVLTSEAFAEEDNQLVLTSSLCAIGSDTMALANDGVLEGRQFGYSGYNWTAKYMTQYLKDGKILDLEEGIRLRFERAFGGQ